MGPSPAAPPAAEAGTETDADAAAALSKAVNRIHRHLRRAVNEATSGGPGEAEVDLMRLAYARPGLRVSHAAADLALAANSVSTMVRRLVDAGLLERATDAEDRRAARLALTGAGRDLLRRRRDVRRAALAGAFADLDDRDRRVLAAAAPALGRLAEALNRRQER